MNQFGSCTNLTLEGNLARTRQIVPILFQEKIFDRHIGDEANYRLANCQLSLLYRFTTQVQLNVATIPF